MAELESLLEVLKAQPDAFRGLTIDKIFRFVACAAKLKDDIMLMQPPEFTGLRAPDNLPPSIGLFLVQACSMPDSYANICWSAFKHTIWTKGEQLQGSIEPHFRNHGHARGISMYIYLSHLTPMEQLCNLQLRRPFILLQLICTGVRITGASVQQNVMHSRRRTHVQFGSIH
jgi:hypothetical protein